MDGLSRYWEEGAQALRAGLPLAACDAWSRWAAAAERRRSPLVEARARRCLGELWLHLDRIGEALSSFERAAAFLTGGPAEEPPGPLAPPGRPGLPPAPGASRPVPAAEAVAILAGLALARERAGRAEQALPWALEARRRAARAVAGPLRARADEALGRVWLSLGRWAEARRALARALAGCGDEDPPERRAGMVTALAAAAADGGAPEAAWGYLSAALADPVLAGCHAPLYIHLGALAAQAGCWEEAARLTGAAWRALWRCPRWPSLTDLGRLSEVMAGVAAVAGDRAWARREWNRAAACYARARRWRDWARAGEAHDRLERAPLPGPSGLPGGLLQELRACSALLGLVDQAEGLGAGLRQRSDLLAAYALALGRRLALGPAQRVALVYAARFCEVGRPDGSPGAREAPSLAQRRRDRRHPEVSRVMLADLPLPPAARAAVLSCRERYDGRGFPGRLAGAAIPLPARILAVAGGYVDAFGDPAAPAGGATGHRRALARLEREAGRRYDPALVAAFCQLHQELHAPPATPVRALA